MPAACSLSLRLSTRKASTTMSCVADAVATRSAPSATISADADGSQRPRKTIAAISKSCDSNSQPRRRPKSFDSTGTSSASTSGAQSELYRVGRADQRKQADRAEIDAALAHPDQERRAGQRERQAGRKAEEHDDQHPPLQIDRKRVGDGCAGGGRCRIRSLAGSGVTGMRRYSPASSLRTGAGMTFELADACFAAICAPSSTC